MDARRCIPSANFRGQDMETGVAAQDSRSINRGPILHSVYATANTLRVDPTVSIFGAIRRVRNNNPSSPELFRIHITLQQSESDSQIVDGEIGRGSPQMNSQIFSPPHRDHVTAAGNGQAQLL